MTKLGTPILSNDLGLASRCLAAFLLIFGVGGVILVRTSPTKENVFPSPSPLLNVPRRGALMLGLMPAYLAAQGTQVALAPVPRVLGPLWLPLDPSRGPLAAIMLPSLMLVFTLGHTCRPVIPTAAPLFMMTLVCVLLLLSCLLRVPLPLALCVVLAFLPRPTPLSRIPHPSEPAIVGRKQLEQKNLHQAIYASIA